MPKPRSLIGEIVLFKVHDSPEVLRPLLVVSEKEGAVSGELFLDWEEDRQALWLQKNMFYLPHKEMRQMPIYGVSRGGKLGQWRKK